MTGPFLSLPVLRATWPNLDAIDKPTREKLRLAHTTWQGDPAAGQRAWADFILGELLGWGDALRWNDLGRLDALGVDVTEHETWINPSFALVEPGEDPKPATTRMLGLMCEPGTQPAARIAGEAWAATPVDRMAQLCRHHEVQLGLVTDGRWWVLVSAPRGKVTTTAVFDAVAWNEAAERDVVRAFLSLLNRRRFFGVPNDEKLVALLHQSEDSQEDITERLGVQVRQAVEMLVAAFGRADTAARERGEPGLERAGAEEVYRAAVTVMMRVVFVLFAEERKLLASDNDLYASAYSAGRLRTDLQDQALQGSETELENSSAAWYRLLALFEAIYNGVDHPRLRMHALDGSLFAPDQFPWLQVLKIDDRTVLHMLKALQEVEIGTGNAREKRTLSFRELDVEQIGYVYEGLLSYDGFRAEDVTVSLIGKEGFEKEVALRDLESLAAECPDVPALAKTISEEFKEYKVGSAKAVERSLAPPAQGAKEEARRKLLSVTRGDNSLTERLLPFFGIIRQDLREQPVVIMPGELFVTDSPLRKNTGTHYTPRFLAEQIVEGALEPLVYHPGPLQTADKEEWELKSSRQILALKVADIAMGSAAFLVAAARYLGDRLMEAWTREDDPAVRDYTPSGTEREAETDQVIIKARRAIIEHCLYGVDINPMAVEMAKLSLWLVSMDPQRPFTFLDDRLAAGDSLLGITSTEQLEYMDLDVGRARREQADLFGWAAEVPALVAEVADIRERLSQMDGSTLSGLQAKRAALREAEEKSNRLRLFADLVVGAALAGSRKVTGSRNAQLREHFADEDARDRDNLVVQAKRLADQIASGAAEEKAQTRRNQWLATDLPSGSFPREPLHWPLVFPEVFAQGGFDAVIGNPPFLGGQRLTGALGTAYREYLVTSLGGGVRGSADLIAYFALRAHEVLPPTGQTGLIATNTLTQGDTREVGLDQIAAGGTTIRQSIKSQPWPSKSAVLEFCAVWTSRTKLNDKAQRLADGVVVPGITPSLDAVSRATGNPARLSTTSGTSFIGSYVLGMGFTMEPAAADELVARDTRNADVLFPYLNGQDLNSNPRCSASRWVINFHNWPEDRAKTYRECYDQVLRLVKPERDRNNRKPRRERWWQYAERTPELVRAIAGLERVVVITRVSKTVMPVMVPTGQVMSEQVVVFATGDTAMLALLSSAPHYWWAKSRGSSMKTDLRYTPSDVFETFPLPELTQELRHLGNRLDTFRRDVMLSRQTGLTKTYNLAFDPSCTDEDIEELRAIHRAIDEATVRAYGWEDRIEAVGGLDHGFHQVGRETRYTVGPAAKREILDSLLELNNERYAEEVAQGLQDKKKGARKPKADEGTLF
ncbi:Eco57I restriction-modification methylase domain-containing protein [Amycolatopsis jiangsuensis]|uniref:site-specific DNA-methyltransferase (adenine-specific) n=1 Tax=Amycolatopsis jiangsuensis TaxID=1181879 RepID=A0A840IQA4_9PSEU|nr:type IIL restriction-modification enzyme MmeI [Amycolatopsis jiangsuensis]MBB4683729.1 hypothetical protein [Amycolatopsis jiangsuensis]